MTAREAKRFAQGLSNELRSRTLTEDEYQRLIQQRPLGRTVRDFVEHIYLPRRADFAAAHYEPTWWRLHILPILGDEDIATFSAEPLRKLVNHLDQRAADPNTKFTEKTAANIWGLVRKFCSELQRSKDPELRLRDDNPALAVQGPNHGNDKAKHWLYPRELGTLVGHTDTPLELARFAAGCVYLFARPGEVLGLEWGHSIDLKHQMVRIDRAVSERDGTLRPHTKTGDVREFEIPDVLMPMLRAMQIEQDGTGLLFNREKKRPQYLRAALLAAGIDRHELHHSTDRSLAIRMHDLRASGITYLAMAGYSDDDIRERAGHADFNTTLLYIRRGKRASRFVGQPFAPLPSRLGDDNVRDIVQPLADSAFSFAPAVGLEPTTPFAVAGARWRTRRADLAGGRHANRRGAAGFLRGSGLRASRRARA